MTATRPQRLWGGTSHLVELLEAMPGGIDLAVRDFALITLTSQLAVSFPEQLVFKGGFVLRHVHGLLRFSKDVDAIRYEPPGHKLDAEEVADAIRQAGIHDVVRFSPNEPATDSARSLDFDNVHVIGEPFPNSSVQIEISYREAVVDPPVRELVGSPFYSEFEVLAMAVEEMAAEKLRTLAQRLRPTDLADLAVMMRHETTEDANIARLAAVKFELVARGQANRVDRIERNLEEMAGTYDDVVPALFPGAPSYREAMEIVWPRIKPLVP
ncbi:MAG: nucleotidyl transferase AbiEii/AbiGii toxin family protein [Acidimicrobiales bacterium]